MQLCYQVATPDVAIADSVTAYQGDIQQSLAKLAGMGYGGVELMTLDPDVLNWETVRRAGEENHLSFALVCTGEIFGQLGLTLTSPNDKVRGEALRRVKRIIEFASFLGAKINLGRVRGQYCSEIPHSKTNELAIEAFCALSDYAAPRGVGIALEPIAMLQTNFINTLAEAEAMVEAVDRQNFGLMMDVFHMNLEERNLYEAIARYSKHNIHVHLADNNRRYPGQCGLDFTRIIEAFCNSGYKGDFCTEIYQVPTMEQAARGAIEHLAPILNKIYGGVKA